MWKLKVADGGKRLLSVNNHVGRQHWEFDPDAGTPEELAEIDRLRDTARSDRVIYKVSSDAFMRLIPAGVKVETLDDVTEEAVGVTLKRGVSYLCSIQGHDGHWPCEFSGLSFLVPPLVMALYVTGDMDKVLSYEHQKEIKRRIYYLQNEDGGWGMHTEGESSMFGSVLNYMALRMLGEGPDDVTMGKARKWILDHGGAVRVTSWGKYWLAVTSWND